MLNVVILFFFRFDIFDFVLIRLGRLDRKIEFSFLDLEVYLFKLILYVFFYFKYGRVRDF